MSQSSCAVQLWELNRRETIPRGGIIVSSHGDGMWQEEESGGAKVRGGTGESKNIRGVIGSRPLGNDRRIGSVLLRRAQGQGNWSRIGLPQGTSISPLFDTSDFTRQVILLYFNNTEDTFGN